MREIELDSVKNRERERARIRAIRGQVGKDIERENKQVWDMYLDKREAARESKYFKMKQADEKKRELSSQQIESSFK